MKGSGTQLTIANMPLPPKPVLPKDKDGVNIIPYVRFPCKQYRYKKERIVQTWNTSWIYASACPARARRTRDERIHAA